MVSIEEVASRGQIAPMQYGRIAIQYRRVECTPPSNMRVIIDQNSGAGAWLRLYVTACPSDTA